VVPAAYDKPPVGKHQVIEAIGIDDLDFVYLELIVREAHLVTAKQAPVTLAGNFSGRLPRRRFGV
jgi:hypothetical protein